MMTIREERDWTEWFRETFGRGPTLADYGNAAFEGRTKEYREAAARSYARLFVSPYGELHPEAGKFLPIEFRQDFRIESPFFQEWEEKVNPVYLKKNEVYMNWYRKTLADREEYKKTALKEKRIRHYKFAVKYRFENIKQMKNLTNQWNKLFDNKILTVGQNSSFAKDFLEIIKKDPTTKRYLPIRIIERPGSKVASPFFDEVRKYFENEKESFEGFFAIKNDYRLPAILELRMEAKRDFEFRRSPDKAKAYAAKLQKRRANRETLNKLFDDSLYSSNH